MHGALNINKKISNYIVVCILRDKSLNLHPVRFAGSAESAAIQQCFSLTTNQRTVLLATINQRNEQGANQFKIEH
jgi:hypothetical protein